MDEKAFAQFLKKAGKKEHVVGGLVAQARQFEKFLAQEHQKGLEAAEAQDIRDYAANLDAGQPGAARKNMRGIALYYQFSDSPALASAAAGIREKQIAKTRQIFKLKDFRGMDPDYIARLSEAGIVHVGHMLESGKTATARQQLSAQTGVPLEAILELVKLSDLSRLGGLKAIRARLYYAAGADTPEKIAQWEAEELRQMLSEFVERTGFDGIAPLPKEVRNAVSTARRLPKIVQY